MGSDGGNAKGAGEVLPLRGTEDIRDVRLASWGGGVVMVIDGRGLGGGGDVANEGVFLEATGYHCGIYLKSPHLKTVNRGGANTGIE